jgi:hypothetical protein
MVSAQNSTIELQEELGVWVGDLNTIVFIENMRNSKASGSGGYHH